MRRPPLADRQLRSRERELRDIVQPVLGKRQAAVRADRSSDGGYRKTEDIPQWIVETEEDARDRAAAADNDLFRPPTPRLCPAPMRISPGPRFPVALLLLSFVRHFLLFSGCPTCGIPGASPRRALFRIACKRGAQL
ncbi:hypothetical protein MAPG_04628 [Magnaporthiopsis poae ATCC 64411]|uniref:Uncharacterized protein n=1 Tax=Magnaporthiopsis poae (strain ATCC 64411 / 73-15) TaxID=644358 RepID=A0A0C4DX88_MAGP6|nr:hypothetical protein MAPG_04628 [Magnaporthiopsis poae ATCC 64411]